MKSVAKLMAIAAIVILLSAGAYALWTRCSQATDGCCADNADCCDDSAYRDAGSVRLQ